jgi:hypothetical protein
MDSLTCWFDLEGYGARLMYDFINDAVTCRVKSVVAHCLQGNSDNVDYTYISIDISKIFSTSVTPNRD